MDREATDGRGSTIHPGDCEKERTRRASFDPKSGEVHGSGSGAGGGGNPDEDYDSDPMGGGGAESQGGPRPAGETRRRPEGTHRDDAE